MNQKINFILALTLMMVISIAGLALAEDLVDPGVPDSWYQAPRTASEVGLTEFHQSPMLDERVTNGELPPVEERLPKDPPVLEPYNGIGEYGGTLNVWDTSLGGGNSSYFAGGYTATAGRPTPDGEKMLPNLLKGWEFNDDSTELTLHLREGMKWSDGQEFTADDYIWWWEHVANNKVLNPVPPQEWNPVPIVDMTKQDKWTVTIKYGSPNPREPEFNFQHHMGFGDLGPAHFMKNFHPDFIGEDKAVALAKSVELDTWDDYYGRVLSNSPNHPEYKDVRPVVRPYVAVERTETYMILERNPFYPFVDTEGNQLPYIDRIRVNLANNPEIAAMKATTGEADFAARYTKASQVPLYKRNEKKGGYTTYLYNQVTGSDAALKLNMNHSNPAIRKVFQDLRFRKAISYAMDRNQINTKLYFGHALVMQTGVPPTSEFYNEDMAKRYTEYDPEKAKALLDEIGMVDVNNDGYRELPNGEEFHPEMLYCLGDRTEYTPILELVAKYLREVGIDMQMKMVSRSLRDNRSTAGNYDMTIWMDDGVVGVKYGNAYQLGMHTAPMPGGYAALSPWPLWIGWFSTKGEEGNEPPENIKQLVEWGKELGYSPDAAVRAEAGQKLTDAHIKNLWTIGTVGMGVKPFMASTKLKNIPTKGLWAWGLAEVQQYWPIQFYFEK